LPRIDLPPADNLFDDCCQDGPNDGVRTPAQPVVIGANSKA
jgi:hypothetical protein